MLDKNDINTIDLISELKDEQPSENNLTNDIEIFKTELKHKINKGDVEGVLGQLGADVITLKERINTKVDNTLFEYTNKINEKAIDSKVSPEYVDVAINKALCNKFVLKSELPDFKNIDFSKFANREDLRFKADKEDVEKKADKAELINLVHVDDLEIFAKKSDIENCAKISDLSRYAARTDLYDLATKEENELKADKLELRKYATKEENELKADKLELNKYALKTDLPNMSNYAFVHDVALKADKSTLELYAKQTDLNNKLDRDMLKILATKEELNLKANQADLNLYASKDALYNKVDKTELEKYALVSDLNNKVDKITAANYATKDEVAEKLCIKEAEKFATKCELNSKANKTDLVNFATREELDLIRKFNPQKLQEIALRVEDVLDFSTKLGEVAYKKDIKELPNKVSKIEFERELSLYKEYISELLNLKADSVSLSELATKEELRIKLTPKVDKTYVDEKLDYKANKSELDSKINDLDTKIETLKLNTTDNLTKQLATKVNTDTFNEVKAKLDEVNSIQDGFIKQNAEKIMEAISKEAENHLLQELSIKATKEDVAKNLELITTNKAELVELIDNSKLELGNTLTEKINLLNTSLDSARATLLEAIDLKADKLNVYTKLDVDNIKTTLEDKINTKADLTLVNDTKTTLEDKINTKADLTTVDSKFLELDNKILTKINDLNQKIDGNIANSTTSINEKINTKADLTLVNEVKQSTETNKINITQNTADITSLKESLNLKANKTDLDIKADKTELSSYITKVEAVDFAKKVDLDIINTLTPKTETALKADKTYVDGINESLTTLINGKANKATVDALAGEVAALKGIDVGTEAGQITDAKLAPIVERINTINDSVLPTLATKESLNLKADKTELDNYVTNVKLELKADKTDLDEIKRDILNNTSTISTKANSNDVYTKLEVDEKINSAKVDISGLATKESLNLKANSSDLEEVKNTANTNKADILQLKTNIADKVDNSTLTNYYNKSDIDIKLGNKVESTILDNYYNKSEVDEKVRNVNLDNYYDKTNTDGKLSEIKTDLSTNYYNKTTIDEKINALNSSPSNIDLSNYYNKVETEDKLTLKTNDTDFQDLKRRFESVESLSLNDVVQGVKAGFEQQGVLYSIIEPLIQKNQELEQKLTQLEQRLIALETPRG